MVNGIRGKKQRVELLNRPIQVESKRVKRLLQGMLARMLEPFWPKKMQALWIERHDLRELAPFMTKISRRLELGGKVHWAGDENKLNRLMEKTQTSGLTVVIGSDALTNGMQRTLMQMPLKARYRLVFLTEHDPGSLMEKKLWQHDFRETVLTSRWPTLNMRRDDWKAIFRAGAEEAARELNLAAVPAIEGEVYRELLAHNWSDQDGAVAILEFGAKCLHTAFAYEQGTPDRITFEHARVSQDRPIAMTAAQARETRPPPPESSEAAG